MKFLWDSKLPLRFALSFHAHKQVACLPRLPGRPLSVLEIPSFLNSSIVILFSRPSIIFPGFCSELLFGVNHMQPFIDSMATHRKLSFGLALPARSPRAISSFAVVGAIALSTAAIPRATAARLESG